MLALAYLAGSIPSGLITGRLIGHTDIRKHGSGNPGVTNVFRVLGWKAAAVVAVVDVLKGFIAARWIGAIPGSGSDLMPVMSGVIAVFGHAYPVFSGFRGGKGIATLAGMLLAVYPVSVPLCLLVFAVGIVATGYVSVGSLGAAAAFPLTVFGLPAVGFEDPGIPLKVFSVVVPLFVLFTHRANVRRLISGTENRFEKAMILRRTKSGVNP